MEIKTTGDIEARLREFILDAKDLERIDKRDKFNEKKWVSVEDVINLVNGGFGLNVNQLRKTILKEIEGGRNSSHD